MELFQLQVFLLLEKSIRYAQIYFRQSYNKLLLREFYLVSVPSFSENNSKFSRLENFESKYFFHEHYHFFYDLVLFIKSFFS